jgi:S-adenosylmethionine synthetase
MFSGGEMASEFLLTSESVGEGHPDKVADRISDAVLDWYLARDRDARVACETLVTQNYVCIAGEVRSSAGLNVSDIEQVARRAIADIGYVEDDGRFSADHVRIQVNLHAQAGEIAKAVDKSERSKQGAGDQGMMFGYATSETPVLMPAPITWAHALTRTLAQYRKSGLVTWLRPDSKSQVSVRYVDGRPVEITRIVVSTQHAASASAETIRELVVEQLIPESIAGAVLGKGWRDRVLVNPSGSFVEGGPATDTGLTGRKIIVDTYGGWGRHGGGAFSGKDATKVDRSAAYMARHVAKNIVAAGLAERCEVQLAYAIGVTEPVSVHVDTAGTGQVDDERICDVVKELFPLTPGGIIKYLDLRRPIFRKTAAGGHFGRDDVDFTWESTHRAKELAKACTGTVAARA